MATIKITLQNTESQVIGLSNADLTWIREELMYSDSNAQYQYTNQLKQVGRIKSLITRNPDNEIYPKQLRKAQFLLKKADKERKVYLMDQDGNFPTGLFPRLASILEDSNIQFDILDNRYCPPGKAKIRQTKDFFKLRYYQTEAVEAAIEQERGVIVAATGAGKTAIICKLLKELDRKSLVIVPSLGILHNMYDNLLEFFHKNDVCLLNSKSSTLSKINVVNIDTLRNMDPSLFEDCAVSIMDEFHHSGASTWQEVNIKHLANCYFRFGMTATNFRTGGDDMALEGVLSNVVSVYTTIQALSDGYLTPPRFVFKEATKEVKGNYQKQYKEGIVDNSERNQIVADLCNKVHKDDQVIVLVKQVKHLELLAKLIPSAITITGKEKDEDRRYIMDQFRKGNFNILIGTSVIGEGVDLPNANVLISAAGGKSKIQVMQNVGRVLRLAPNKKEAIIYDFDDFSSYLAQHSEARRQIYMEEYGAAFPDKSI